MAKAGTNPEGCDDDGSISDNVDICITIVGGEAPTLPLRQEVLTNGIELVYNARGIGQAAVSKEQKRREAIVLAKLKRIEEKLSSKPSYRRTRKKKQAIKMVKDLRSKLERSASGISYNMYLEELMRLYNKNQDDDKSQPEPEDLMTTLSMLEFVGDQSIDDIDDQSEISFSQYTSVTEDTMFSYRTKSTHDNGTDDSEMLSYRTRSSYDNGADDSERTSPETWKHLIRDIDTMSGRSGKSNLDTCSESGEHLLEDDGSTDSPTPMSMACETYTSEKTSLSCRTSNTGDTHVRSNMSPRPGVLKKRSRTVPTCDSTDCETGIGLESVAENSVTSGSSSKSSVRFKGIKPNTSDNLARARDLIDRAKFLKRSFSSDSSGSTGISITIGKKKPSSLRNSSSTNQLVALGGDGSKDQRPIDQPVIVRENDRYHLFVTKACPWSHRTLIVRALKSIQSAISVSFVKCTWDPQSLWESLAVKNTQRDHSFWAIDNENGNENDSIFATFREQFLDKQERDHGSVHLPILWDKKLNIVASNNSLDIMRILNFEFNKWSRRPKLDLFPKDNEEEIERINALVHNKINIGVYRCGLATTQERYEAAINDLTSALEEVNAIVRKRGFLLGNRLTESDIRLFVTLFRFDEVYRILFKTNTRTISTIPGLLNYVRDIYNIKGVKEMCDMDAIKSHYFGASSESGVFIIPRGAGFMDLLQKEL